MADAGAGAVTDRSRDNLLRKADVLRLTGLSAYSLERLIKLGRFVTPHRLGPTLPRWSEAAVRAWMISLYEPAMSLEPAPPRVPGRRRFIHEGLLCSQAPEHDGMIRSATKLSQHIVHVDDLSMRANGVYFLWRGQTVVYVGQTRTGFNRLAQHIANPAKKFDGISFIRCPAADLDRVEREYIDTLLPEYNADGITLGMKRRRAMARRAISKPSPAEDRSWAT